MTDRMYTAEVIADSISPNNDRITTVKVIYPHAVHKDMLRHRCMNRSVESFRAQPPEKIIENLRNGHAFKPDVFAKRTKGMGQAAEAIDGASQASWYWDQLLERALVTAERLLELDVAKQQINFVLQDFSPLTEIITATDWSNFYALRTETKEDGTPVARPEVYKTAKAIKDAIEASQPVGLSYSDLHLPMLTKDDRDEILCRQLAYPEGSFEVERYWYYVSAGRCARISYGEYDWASESREVSYARAEKLIKAGHMSPFEHQAKPFSQARWLWIQRTIDSLRRAIDLPPDEQREMRRQLFYSGNLCGWVPARKTFRNEHDYGLLRGTTT